MTRTRTALQTLRDRAQAERAAQNPRGMTELDELIDKYDRTNSHTSMTAVLRYIADRLPVYPRTGTVGPQVVSLPGESDEEHAARQAERDAAGVHASAVQEEKARKALDPETPINAALGSLSPDGVTFVVPVLPTDPEYESRVDKMIAEHRAKPAEDRTNPPPGWDLRWDWDCRWFVATNLATLQSLDPWHQRADAIAACWAEVDREREKSLPAALDADAFAPLRQATINCTHLPPGLDGCSPCKRWREENGGEAERTRKAVEAERERLAKMFDDEHRCNTAAHIRDSKP